MKHILVATLMCGVASSPVLGADPSGKFSVFGPSAEREAFFENQRVEKENRIIKLREEALEREKLALEKAKAEADSEAARAQARAANRVPLEYCWSVPATVDDGGSTPSVNVIDPAMIITCRSPIYRRYSPGHGSLDIGYGPDGWTGTGHLHRPGLTIDLDF